jgi:hypothetical protein
VTCDVFHTFHPLVQLRVCLQEFLCDQTVTAAIVASIEDQSRLPLTAGSGRVKDLDVLDEGAIGVLRKISMFYQVEGRSRTYLSFTDRCFVQNVSHKFVNLFTRSLSFPKHLENYESSI